MLTFTLVSVLFSLRGLAAACECPPLASVRLSIRNSTAVFSGEVISEEYRDVKANPPSEPGDAKALVIKLKVKRWWKGNGAEEVSLYTSVRKYPDGRMSLDAEDFRFHKGESYLVYAYGQEDKLQTSGCSRTRIIGDAEQDLLELGEGKVPEKKVVRLWLWRSLTKDKDYSPASPLQPPILRVDESRA